MKKTYSCIFILFFFSFISTNCIPHHKAIEQPFTLPEGNIELSFSVTADIRRHTGSKCFGMACKRISSGGAGQFMVSVGDIDPPEDVFITIRQYIGKNYIWYPVVGNHDADTVSHMTWLRAYNLNGNTLPNIVNVGPIGCIETTYSFDYNNVHCIVINEYFNGNSDTGADGDVVDVLYNWLIHDLVSNTKPIVLVFGHEPAYPQPDEESGRLRHKDDSLNAYPFNRDRFWNALKSYGVKAYICAHTHNYSAVRINGIWQIDTGHTQGRKDKGARSTFIMFYAMENNSLWFYTYRLNFETNTYELTDTNKIE